MTELLPVGQEMCKHVQDALGWCGVGDQGSGIHGGLSVRGLPLRVG